MAQKQVVPITFTITKGDTVLRKDSLSQEVIKIGRDQKSHLRIEDESVSRMHAVIEAKPGDVQVIDLGSATGTLVNGQSVNKGAIKTGDVIKLGEITLTVELGEPVDAVASAPAATAAPAAAATAVAATAPAAPASDLKSRLAKPAVAAAPAAAAAVPAPSTARSPLADMQATPAANSAVRESEEVYQLIKRADINPNEVEVAGTRAIEVSILWKSSILHVAHLEGNKGFTLSSGLVTKGKSGLLIPSVGALAANAAAIGWRVAAGAKLGNVSKEAEAAALATPSLVVTGVAMLSASILSLYAAVHHQKEDSGKVTTFVVGSEVIQNAPEVPVIVNQTGVPQFVFLPGSTGEADIGGVKYTLQEMIERNLAKTYKVAGAWAVDMPPDGRFKMEVGGLTIQAKSVARPRRVAGAGKRDKAMAFSFVGAILVVAGAITAMKLAYSADDGSLISATSDEERLAELTEYVKRQEERQPEEKPPEEVPDQPQEQVSTRPSGERAKGPQGAAGRPDVSRSANGSMQIEDRHTRPHTSNMAAAANAARENSILAVLDAAGPAAAMDNEPFGAEFDPDPSSGTGDHTTRGALNGNAPGDAFGWGGLGPAGQGLGGGGTGGGYGVGGPGVMGTGPGGNGGIGGPIHARLPPRAPRGPSVHAAPPTVSGSLNPETIRRVVLRNLNQVKRCHEQGLHEDPQMGGRVSIRFTIAMGGLVTTSDVADKDPKISSSVAQCIAGVVRRLQFAEPPDGSPTRITYPFSLDPPEPGGDSQ